MKNKFVYKFKVSVISNNSNCAFDMANQYCGPKTSDSDIQSNIQPVDGINVKADVYSDNNTQSHLPSTSLAKNADILMIVCDMSKRESFENLKSLMQFAKRYGNDKLSTVVVGIMPNSSAKQVVTPEELKTISKGLPCIQISNNSKQAINQAFMVSIKDKLENVGVCHKMSDQDHKNLDEMVRHMQKANSSRTRLGKKFSEVKVDAMMRKISGDPKVCKAYNTVLKDKIKEHPTSGDKKTLEAIKNVSSKLSKQESDLSLKQENLSGKQLT